MQSTSSSDKLRAIFEGRPHWMNALMLFCAFMAFIYLPWDIFVKPVEIDQEVWFGILLTGWAAKLAAVPHWLVYAAGAYGFWRMTPWMWPWAAVYVAQVALGMAVWAMRELEGAGSPVFALASFVPFAYLTWMLWKAKARFQPEASAGGA